MDKTVCNLESKDCMLHRYEECPGTEPLEEFHQTSFNDSDPEDMIEFKQWIHTDRDTLDTKQLRESTSFRENFFPMGRISLKIGPLM
jgi:hypothetical protein